MVFLFKWGMIEQEFDFIRRRLSIFYSSRDFLGYYLFTHLISLETASAQKLWAICHSSNAQSVLVIEPGNALVADKTLVLQSLFHMLNAICIGDIQRNKAKFAISLCVAGVIVIHILTTFRCCVIFPLPERHKIPSHLDMWNAVILFYL